MFDAFAQVAQGATSQLTWSLVVAAFLLGLRHGIDWDHIAAITDIGATQEEPGRGFKLGTLYVAGHAAVVLALGTVIILVGLTLPSWVDALMGRVVGVTLIALGVFVVISLIREKGRFRPRSRWMIVFAFARSVRARLSRSSGPPVQHDHPHAAAGDAHHESAEEPSVEAAPGRSLRAPVHSHTHTHEVDVAEFGSRSALGVGALHGIGAETPTQVVLFLAAAGAGGVSAGLLVLVIFLTGLILANTMITVLATFGFQRVANRARLYMAMGAVTAVLSLIVGTVLLFGQDTLLPALIG